MPRAEEAPVLPAPASLPRPWTDAYPPGVPIGYRCPDVHVTRFLDDAARDFPTDPALVHGRATWTWDELVTLVDRAAARLAELGTRRGEVVAVVGGATAPTVVVMLAAWRLGAVVAAVDVAVDDDVLAGRLAAAAPSIVVTEEVRLAEVEELRDGLPSCRHLVVVDPVRWAGWRSRLVATARERLRAATPGDETDGPVRLDDVVGRGSRPTVRQESVAADAPALLAWSSLAEASASPVLLSRTNLVVATFQARLWVPDVRAGREVLLGGVGPGHVQGLVTGVLWGLLAAATVVLLDRPDGAELVDAVDRHGVSVLALHPAQAAAMTAASRSSRADLGTVRVALAIGAALGPGVRLAFEEATEGRLRQAYGCTGAAGITHAMPVYGRIRDGTIGLPVTDTVAAVRRLDASGDLAAAGEVGELVVAGAQVAAGSTEDGWLATGDLAEQAPNGVFRLLGRVEDAVVRDDVRVLPQDVEDALLEHPAVQAAAVVATGATRVEAAVQLGRRRRPSVQKLDDHLRQLLPADQLPDAIHVVDSLPTTTIGTIDRPALREQLTSGRDEGATT